MELGPPSLASYLGLTHDKALWAMLSFFVEKDMLYSYSRDSDAHRFATTYTEEPEELKAFRRISYTVKVNPVDKPACSWVEIRWSLEQRSYLDPSWRFEPVPEGYKPLLTDSLRDLLQSKPCSQVDPGKGESIESLQHLQPTQTQRSYLSQTP